MAGSIVVSKTVSGDGLTKYSVAWTSDASGNVSANAFVMKRGRLLQAKTVPGAGGAAPTAGYLVTLPDADGLDLLMGLGASRSASNAEFAPLNSGQGEPASSIRWFEGGTVTPTITAAGNAKTGTLILYVGP